MSQSLLNLAYVTGSFKNTVSAAFLTAVVSQTASFRTVSPPEEHDGCRTERCKSGDEYGRPTRAAGAFPGNVDRKTPSAATRLRTLHPPHETDLSTSRRRRRPSGRRFFVLNPDNTQPKGAVQRRVRLPKCPGFVGRQVKGFFALCAIAAVLRFTLKLRHDFKGARYRIPLRVLKRFLFGGLAVAPFFFGRQTLNFVTSTAFPEACALDGGRRFRGDGRFGPRFRESLGFDNVRRRDVFLMIVRTIAGHYPGLVLRASHPYLLKTAFGSDARCRHRRNRFAGRQTLRLSPGDGFKNVGAR